MLKCGVHQRKNDVGLIMDRLDIYHSKATEAAPLIISSRHDQITGKIFPFQKGDDGGAPVFECGPELPSECFGCTNRHQSIALRAEQVPERVEAFIEAVEQAGLRWRKPKLGWTYQVSAVEGRGRCMFQTRKKRNA